MRKDKNEAIKLRKIGKSYSQISVKLGIGKSTLSYWLKDIKISRQAKEKLDSRCNAGTRALIKRNKKQTIIAEKKAEIIKNKARKEVVDLLSNNLFLIGLSLYWAEGYKKGAYGSKWKCVDFTNSDPEMIKIMMNFFRVICRVNNEKFKIQLIAHKNININNSIKFWSNITGVSRDQFIKTSPPNSLSRNKRKVNILKYGTIHIRIYNVELFYTIIGWIEGAKKHFARS